MASKLTKKKFKAELEEVTKDLFRIPLSEATPHQVYLAVCAVVRDTIIDDWMATQDAIKREDPKIVYYMSMEFLTGRYLGNNLLNLTAYKEVGEALAEMGYDLNALEDEERDPALGNGGLGRLAACFLDSLSTLGYTAYGCGIRYHYGLFRQKIEDGFQTEQPDNWLTDGFYPFELRRREYSKQIRFGGHVEVDYDSTTGRNHFRQEGCDIVIAVPYDLPVLGYDNRVVNTLRIWDAEPATDFGLDSFDRGEYEKAVEKENLARTLTRVLYPNDNHTAGKELRLKQQYFFVSASIQSAVAKFKKRHKDVRKLNTKVVFHMNDTHPTLTVAELMRVLMDDEGLTWDEAWETTTKTCAYTNHTIMAEALEKWPIDLFQRLLPRVYQIVEEIDRRFREQVREKFHGDEDRVNRMAILADGKVHMAHMAIVGSFSVNGVAALHTEILKKRELHDFYEMMPKKFSNKTNGITQRRFLLHGNPLLADWVSAKVGKGWITDLSQTEGLANLAGREKAQEEFRAIKRANKERLAAYIKEHNGIDVDPDSIFDVQVKRLHEYKRQFLNILHVMHLYNQLKTNPKMDFVPRTFIFGAKASAGYERAKAIIKLINSVAEVVNNDESIKNKIKVVFIEDYRVSNAELIYAAADISEQISTASREASGTSNMKFMLNGALTLGTLDGANVEIVEEVGEENAFIFGYTAEQIMDMEQNGGYDPVHFYENDEDIRRVLDQLTDGTFSKGDTELFRDLRDSLLTSDRGKADQYFILGDFKAYAEAQKKAEELYKDSAAWAKAAILNIAHVGKFSSDRTIQDYVNGIWKLGRIVV